MPNEKPKNARENEALALAQKAIEASAAGRHEDAILHWRAASAYADAHLPGADIYHWIKSGLGAALYDIGAYEESIAVSKLALDWCSALKQPLPALTMAKSYRRLGDHAAAQISLEWARGLVGDSILKGWDAD